MDSGKKTTEVSALITLCHKSKLRDLPGGSGVKTLCFHCRGLGWGTKIPHATWHGKKKKKSACYKHDITVDVDLDHLQRSCLPAFSTAESLPLPPLSPASMLCSLEGSHYAPSTLEKQGVKIHLLEGRGSMSVI